MSCHKRGRGGYAQAWKTGKAKTKASVKDPMAGTWFTVGMKLASKTKWIVSGCVYKWSKCRSLARVAAK